MHTSSVLQDCVKMDLDSPSHMEAAGVIAGLDQDSENKWANLANNPQVAAAVNAVPIPPLSGDSVLGIKHS